MRQTCFSGALYEVAPIAPKRCPPPLLLDRAKLLNQLTQNNNSVDNTSVDKKSEILRKEDIALLKNRDINKSKIVTIHAQHNNKKPIMPSSTQPTSTTDRASAEALEKSVAELIKFIGDDPARTELAKTPARFLSAMQDYFEGYRSTPADFLRGLDHSKQDYHDEVMFADIPFFSHCEHHIALFSGTISLAYYPGASIIGISKIARLIDCLSRRLQTQERLTQEIAESFHEALSPTGTAVFVQARHSCVELRGARKAPFVTRTRCFLGNYSTEANLRDTFLNRADKFDNSLGAPGRMADT